MGDYRTTEYASVDPDATIAVIPLAAIEQHGPHLPLSTDTTIMEGMLETVIARLPDDLDIRILPIQAVGKSNEHLYAPGTLTLPATTLIDGLDRARRLGGPRRRAQDRVRQFAWRQRGDHGHRLARAARRPCGHGRQDQLAAIRPPSRAVLRESEERYGIHGGDIETSLMLHFRPDLVDMGAALNFASSVERAEAEFELLRPTGTHAFAWIATDLNPAGVVGEAALATAEKGRATAEFQADGFIRLLRDVRKARLADWLSEM